ncbi:MAG: hypothetical protein ACT4OP_03980 [Actinomycetota bacterium]
MLGILRWQAVLAGIASGALGSGVVFALLAALARLSGSEAIAGLSLSLSVLFGFLSGGYVAGRMAPFSARFHGSITGLAIAGLVVIVSQLGGSPAPIASILLLALMAIVVGGLGGILGRRRR